jgi:D-alanyl-D-alanine carboxypeptidase (penicillin-binding protein 5/6)
MTDPEHIIDTPADAVVAKNTFPIVAQLGVLAFILAAVFGSLYLVGANQQIAEPTPVAPQPVLHTALSTKDPIIPKLDETMYVRAEAAYVWDIRTQRALYSKNADEVLPLASLTKLMTTLLAHELITEQTNTTVSLNAIRQEGSSGLTAGEEFTAKELQELALISSSNDAAYALAANVGELLGAQNPETQFVTGMNIRAEELGLETLHFENTTGLDLSQYKPGAVGSARDISFLMEHIVTDYPELIAPTQETTTRVYNNAGLYHDVRNTNTTVSQIPNLIGSKTGYTDLAGGNLTIAFDAGYNRPIVITVLGSTREERFTDVLRLVHAIQDSFRTKDVE